jgi:hypothetical protein
MAMEKKSLVGKKASPKSNAKSKVDTNKPKASKVVAAFKSIQGT